ncbi:uncharacterized protein METZ01_LOCUS244425 [marine metagenome]|uniref:Uncharacterized protein n=1 Tax=marine metagenome TaxID=408172 RepID=A0A382HYN7_9ZZZZ
MALIWHSLVFTDVAKPLQVKKAIDAQLD